MQAHVEIFSRLFVVLIVASAAFSVAAQETPSHKQNARPESHWSALAPQSATMPRGSAVRFSYSCTQPQFYLRHIVIKHDAAGHGKVTFVRLNEEGPIVEYLEISRKALARISALWQGLRFVDSDTNYQSDKQFPLLGT